MLSHVPKNMKLHKNPQPSYRAIMLQLRIFYALFMRYFAAY